MVEDYGEVLPEGLCRSADGALRREAVHSMLRRLDGWDYRQRAIYQITVTLADRASEALGRLEVRTRGSGEWVSVAAARGRVERPEAVEAHVVPSALGRAMVESLHEMERLFPDVAILALQVMPDHFHFIVFVKSPIAKPLGSLVRGFKAGAAKRWRALLETPAENDRAADGVAAGASGARPVLANSFASVPVWSPGFQDTVLFHEGQLADMRRYLADNPRRRAIKALWPTLFKVVGELERSLDWGDGRHWLGAFSALGNSFLLDRQRKPANT